VLTVIYQYNKQVRGQVMTTATSGLRGYYRLSRKWSISAGEMY